MVGAARRRWNVFAGLGEGTGRERDNKLTQALAAFLLALFLMVLLLVAFSSLDAVPDVTGMTSGEASSTLEKAGFKVDETESKAGTAAQEGKVVDQSPDAGARVFAGSTVKIAVATSSTSLTEEGGTGAGLSAAGEGIPLPEWTGNPAREDTIVPYSSATDPSGVRVPSVMGMSQSAALSALSASGFHGVVRTGYGTTNVPAGTVFGQKPSAESYVAAGSTVYIYISNGPPRAGSPYPQAPYTN